MFDLIGGAFAVFVVTNVDGFVLLTILFSTPGTATRTVSAPSALMATKIARPRNCPTTPVW